MPNFLKTSTAAAAPVALAANFTSYHKAVIIACKGLNGPTASPNANTVFLGSSGAASQQPIELQPGDMITFDAAANGMRNLQSLFLAVSADGDGVVVEYN